MIVCHGSNAEPEILQMKYASVAQEVARLGDISLDEALRRVYESRTYVPMSEGIADMHCRSDRYLAEEILTERT